MALTDSAQNVTAEVCQKLIGKINLINVVSKSRSRFNNGIEVAATFTDVLPVGGLERITLSRRFTV